MKHIIRQPEVDLLDSLRELIEICRTKCGPHDEIILENGRTNHQALVDAIANVERLGYDETPKVKPKSDADLFLESVRESLAAKGHTVLTSEGSQP